MRIGIIDLGTNTFKLLVAERTAGEATGLKVLHAEEVPSFLGRGGIEDKRITVEAAGRGMVVLRALMEKARALGADRVEGFGTSALRNARNGAAYAQQVLEELGLPIQIIPGEEEAGLILDGVRQAVPFGNKPKLVMDIGGGSTEFILATGHALMWKHSFEIGTTRLLERFPMLDPMDLDTQLRMAQHIDAQLEQLWSVVDRHWPQTLVGSAGSFDSIAAMIALARQAPLADDAVSMDFDTSGFDALKDRILPLTRAERSKVEGLPAHRRDTIIPALMLVERVLLHGMTHLQWSRYSLKEGAASRVLGQLNT
jgi:exopolyphosphatase/guanosine-5'-triphosphate,3'-diphosphate pyrophosphatase